MYFIIFKLLTKGLGHWNRWKWENVFKITKKVNVFCKCIEIRCHWLSYCSGVSIIGFQWRMLSGRCIIIRSKILIAKYIHCFFFSLKSTIKGTLKFSEKQRKAFYLYASKKEKKYCEKMSFFSLFVDIWNI